MATRIGIDVGGTFTDLIYYDDKSGEVVINKVPSVADNPAEACINAIQSSLSEQQVAECEYFLHSSTVGLNALLQRQGATVGLLCTRGFRDILEIRRGLRLEMYNLLWKSPQPLVPRHLRIPVTERMRADGSVYTPLKEDDVREAAATFLEEGVNSVAVCFLHSWNNAEHELKAEEILRAAGFRGDISLSHRISGEYREYERTSTAAIDAFVRPKLSDYVTELGNGLDDMGFSGELMINRSGGGSMRFNEAVNRPFETIMSGPVAGAGGAGELSKMLGIHHLVTADVGGTSFDTCIVQNGRVNLMFEAMIAGHAIQAPWVDVRSIGAGGGSIAYVDEGGLLQVGPQSAGANPGPACYKRGGTQPTVTDAALTLGMLGEGQLASGLTLDRDLAANALEPIAAYLNASIEEAAQGVMTIASVSMANATRELTLQRGIDPRELSLLAFGGAGPLMATLLATEMHIPQIIIPPYAGNFSAWGLLGADVVRYVSRTHVMPLCKESIQLTNSILAELFNSLSENSQESKTNFSEVTREVSIDMRYMGQEHSISVPISCENGLIEQTAEELASDFTTAYKQAFQITLDDPIEIVTIRATLKSLLPRRQTTQFSESIQQTSETKEIKVWSFTEKQHLPFKLVDRGQLNPGTSLPGPAIITEATSTTYLDAGFICQVHESGCLQIHRK